MEWIEPNYSKKKVKKAGEFLVSEDFNIHDEKIYSLAPVFFNWRSSHAFPMQIMLDFLRKNALRIDEKALVVQRLKRVSSIIGKLGRQNGMSLSRMEDIAGCRAVVNKVREVRLLQDNLKKSRTKHILHRERDYILNPKDSGYRSVHLVFKYNGGKEKYHGLYIELQLRSKIQHSWATAVEVVGTFTRQALKASLGDERWLDFFKVASAEFAKLENCPIHKSFEGIDTFNKLREYFDILDIRKRLSAFKVATKTINDRSSKKGESSYYLLLLDLERRVINLRRYDKDQLEKATQVYNDDEKKYSKDKNKDLVLVSAQSLRDLKRAYPNYFLDTESFIKYIDEVYAAHK